MTPTAAGREATALPGKSDRLASLRQIPARPLGLPAGAVALRRAPDFAALGPSCTLSSADGGSIPVAKIFLFDPCNENLRHNVKAVLRGNSGIWSASGAEHEASNNGVIAEHRAARITLILFGPRILSY